jgi:hypothetical protein
MAELSAGTRGPPVGIMSEESLRPDEQERKNAAIARQKRKRKEEKETKAS